MLEIRIEKKIVNIYRDDEESPIYQIRVSHLGQTRIEDDTTISEWIDHLMSKTWMDNGTLYSLAVIIQEKVPENQIDWSSTFFPVERREYLNHVRATKRLMAKKEKKKLDVEDLKERLTIGVEEQNDFVNDQIKQIVMKNLKDYGLA